MQTKKCILFHEEEKPKKRTKANEKRILCKSILTTHFEFCLQVFRKAAKSAPISVISVFSKAQRYTVSSGIEPGVSNLLISNPLHFNNGELNKH